MTQAIEWLNRKIQENVIVEIQTNIHLYFPQFLSEITKKDKAMQMNFELLALCDDVLVFVDKITEGMEAEIDRAKNVYYFTTKC